MAVVTYKHENGACDFQADMEVGHRKLIVFRCPKCEWIAAFIPTIDYDSTGDFEHSSFTPVDPSLFIHKPKGGRRVGNKANSTNRKAKHKPGKKAKVITIEIIPNREPYVWRNKKNKPI